MAVLITKMDGELEPFNELKLDRSLMRAGASPEMRKHVIRHVREDLREKMTTQEIYERAFEHLRKEEKHPVAARYSIKRAVLDLGPSGFPFEQFVAEILKAMGYRDVKTGTAVRGKCAFHEVDVTAQDENGKHMAAEVKFHNSLGIKTDLKVALYVKARWEDISANGTVLDEGWLITNTRFTRNAIRYGMCNNLYLLGWDYPRDRGLEVLIDTAHVHPITALTSLTQPEKRILLDNDIVLCRQLQGREDMFRKAGIDAKRKNVIEGELSKLSSI